jgi:hypothetical protein
MEFAIAAAEDDHDAGEAGQSDAELGQRLKSSRVDQVSIPAV